MDRGVGGHIVVVMRRRCERRGGVGQCVALGVLVKGTVGSRGRGVNIGRQECDAGDFV